VSQRWFVLDQEKLARYPEQPHGGKLVNRMLTGKARDEAMERSKQWPMIVVDIEAVITLEMIATGVLSPNEGFMNEADYKSVLTDGRLKSGLIWPVPLSFAPTGDRNKQVIQSLSVGDEATLTDETKEPVAKIGRAHV